MKLVNPKNPVMASWLRDQGFRLDAPPFLSGAIEARKLLEQLPVKKESLVVVDQRAERQAIFNGPKFARTYVEEPEHGVPLLAVLTCYRLTCRDSPLLESKMLTILLSLPPTRRGYDITHLWDYWPDGLCSFRHGRDVVFAAIL